MMRNKEFPRFDADKWVTVARLAVAASVVLTAVTVAILLMVDPPDQCPNWHIKKSAQSLWTLLVFWTAPVIGMGCVIAIRWNWTVRKEAEAAGRKVHTLFFGHVTPPAVPVNYVLINTCLVLSVVSQLPLVLLVTNCTDWLRP
jgi:hypothetical protein